MVMKKLINVLLLIIFFMFFPSCDDEEITNTNPVIPPSGAYEIDFQPSWSPDGHTIAYYHRDSTFEGTGIYLIDTNGTNKRFLIGDMSFSPDFSPDGSWITFANGQIYKIKINGDSLTQLTNGDESFFPAISNNGRQIIYDYSNGSINKIDFNGINYSSLCVCGRMANWSPDNRYIVLIGYANNYSPSEIYSMDSSGNNLSRITNNINWDYYPRFSPDGNKILFTQMHEASINYQLYTVNIDGTGLTRLTDTQGYTADYSPDGEKIVYCDPSPGDGRLWIIYKDGSNKRQLTF
jgi:Tol biopolymer transport system component